MNKAQRISHYLVLGGLTCGLFTGLSAAHASPPPGPHPFASNAFLHTWQRTDRPVAMGQVQRSYYWGPQPNSGGIMEDYQQGINGKRLVQYYDKSRMEINNPFGNPDDPFYVTNGLLTEELISGRMQVGNSQWVTRTPANIPLASDTDDPKAPTYISFQGVSNTPLGDHLVGNHVSQYATQTINKAGQVSNDPSKANVPGTRFVYYEEITAHNIPQVIWDFVNLSGPTYNHLIGQNQVAQLSVPWYYTTGLPISEPYWAKVKIANVPNVDVMIQAFERRVVTYVPSAPEGFKVQMSNIGQHYYDWRYGNNPPPPTVTPQPSETPNPALPTATSEPSQPTETPVPSQPTATSNPAQPTATPTSQPQQAPAQFQGTWIMNERLVAFQPHIFKLRIEASGSNLTLHGFTACTDGLCEAESKTKQYTGEPFDMTLAGIPIKISLMDQGTKLKVVENQNEVFTFYKLKASDFEGSWLNENANGDIAKFIMKANGDNLTVTRYNACGNTICEKETRTGQFSGEPFTITLNGDTFKFSVENPGPEPLDMKANTNDAQFPRFYKVTADSFDGKWISTDVYVHLTITHTGNTIHIEAKIGECIDPPCGPIPTYNRDVQFTGEPVTFTIPGNYVYKLTFDHAAGTRLKSIRTESGGGPFTEYLDKVP